jgi:hypothetical protein
MTAIENCRTAALGGHVLRCEKCSLTQIAYNSCLMGKFRNGELAAGEAFDVSYLKRFSGDLRLSLSP